MNINSDFRIVWDFSIFWDEDSNTYRWQASGAEWMANECLDRDRHFIEEVGYKSKEVAKKVAEESARRLFKKRKSELLLEENRQPEHWKGQTQ